MVLCPTCGERLRTFSEKRRYDKHSAMLLRFLVILSAILPPIGAIVGVSIKKRHPILGKICFKYAVTGIVIYIMLLLLALICWLAMTFLGVSYL